MLGHDLVFHIFLCFLLILIILPEVSENNHEATKYKRDDSSNHQSGFKLSQFVPYSNK